METQVIDYNDKRWWLYDAPHCVLDSRFKQAKGHVIDIGCWDWQWSKPLAQYLPVIGIDPHVDEVPPNCTFEQGVIGPWKGTAHISSEGISSSLFRECASAETQMFTLDRVLHKHKVEEIAAMKVNIEGAEYALLLTWLPEWYRRIDQLAISFHTFCGFSEEGRDAALAFLSKFFDIWATWTQYDWYICVRK